MKLKKVNNWLQQARLLLLLLLLLDMRLDGVMVTALDWQPTGPGFSSQLLRCRVGLGSAQAAHTCLCHRAEYFDAGQKAVTLRSWERNCRSGVAMTMRHRLCDYQIRA